MFSFASILVELARYCSFATCGANGIWGYWVVQMLLRKRWHALLRRTNGQESLCCRLYGVLLCMLSIVLCRRRSRGTRADDCCAFEL
jgi:hypothetical protein